MSKQLVGAIKDGVHATTATAGSEANEYDVPDVLSLLFRYTLEGEQQRRIK